MSVGFIPTLSAQKLENGAALPLPGNAQVGVLVVFKLHHQLIVLKPFKMMHKGNFARSPGFMGDRGR
jgi:hypothetical protein